MTLAEEAQRYLAVVDFFRAAGCAPRWRRETWAERAQLSGSSMHDGTKRTKRRKRCPH